MQKCFPSSSSVCPKWSVTMQDCIQELSMQDIHHDVEIRPIEVLESSTDHQMDTGGIVTMQKFLSPLLIDLEVLMQVTT